MKDFCTLFPDTIASVYIGDICRIHDRIYGGKRQEKRKRGDQLLRNLVNRRFREAGKPWLGRWVSRVMYAGTRAFGWIWWDR